MDRRNLLFFFTMMMSMLLVNAYFEWNRQEAQEEFLAKQSVWEAEQREKLELELAPRMLEASDLALVKIGRQEGEEAVFSYGYRSGELLVVMGPTSETLALEDGTWTLQEQNEQGLAIYSQGASKTLASAEWPELGSYDLQLVELGSDWPAVSLAFLEDGVFSIPLDAPLTDALALIKSEDGKSYLPLGVYRAETGALESIEGLELAASSVFKAPEIPQDEGVQQEFYVLENDFQQLVFSNISGSLVEINLPFQGDDNTVSEVREIGFDRDMVEHAPENARFPSMPYFSPAEEADGSLVAHDAGGVGGYYPLLRRDVRGPTGNIAYQVPADYYAFNVVSKFPELARLKYRVKSFTKNQIVFEGLQRERKITKTFTLSDDPNAPYVVDLKVTVQGNSQGLWLSTGVPEVELISNSPAPALKYRKTRGDSAEVRSEKLPSETTEISDVEPDWVSNSNGFFGIILDPLTAISPDLKMRYVHGDVVPTRLLELDRGRGRFKSEKLPGYAMMLPLPSKATSSHFRIYAGPLGRNPLLTVDQTFTDPDTGVSPDYIATQSFHGWFSFISQPFAKFLFFLMNNFHRVTGSWVVSIVLLTVILRLLLYPLNSWSLRSMKRLQLVQPEVQALQEKYKKDPKKLQMEMMQLYRDKGVNPLGGCFPMLIQIPFLIGMFDLLKSTFELRGASFIPGWIDDLAAPDVLFSWDFNILLIGNELHLLPILLGGVMFLQAKISSSSKPDEELTEQQRQQKTMSHMMTVVFTVMFYNFPSGLCIYWVSSMGLSMLQQWWINRSLDAEAAAEKTQPNAKRGGRKKKTAKA